VDQYFPDPTAAELAALGEDDVCAVCLKVKDIVENERPYSFSTMYLIKPYMPSHTIHSGKTHHLLSPPTTPRPPTVPIPACLALMYANLFPLPVG
jgi:hypothetical protein